MNEAQSLHQNSEDTTHKIIVQQRSYWSSLTHVGSAQRFWGRLLVATLFAVPALSFYASHLLFHVIGEIESMSAQNPELAMSLIGDLRSIGFLFFSSIVLLCMIAIYMIFFISVRVFGPRVAILRFIDQMKHGNYAPYRNLRRDDQLKDIWAALQELAEHLRANDPRYSKPKK